MIIIMCIIPLNTPKLFFYLNCINGQDRQLIFELLVFIHSFIIIINLTPFFCLSAQWEWLSSSEEYVLGEPMYFEAQTAPLSQDERLYVHSCYATSERSHTSKPQFSVVKNFG